MGTETLDKAYEAKGVEKRWYEYWEQEGLFSADDKPGKKGYSIVIPPPNVTGVLHMGHALNNTLQDILCRYRRHRGDDVLWVPGTDHAGIATQNVVEKMLAKQGITRHEIGREKFIEQVWEWREKYGSAIINQLKRLGSSCDWERERFTMDEGLSTAVRKVFVTLYNQGLIYQGNYIINWCPRCTTALADLEVEHEDADGNLYHILYPFKDGDGGVTVATTRPETMFGDTAVAVNPEDSRYEALPSESVILPLLEKEIPIIKDSYVDESFGTGALKVTPAHDTNDFEIGKRHNLPTVKVISDTGTMTEDAGRFAGLDRMECRKVAVEELKEKGLLIKVEPITHSVGKCYRCSTVIEPNLSLQWFVKTKPLAEKAIEAVQTGKTKVVPKMWEKTYYEWMFNIRDWCISRQIWWGHQIPAWTCAGCEKMIVEMEAPEACPDCGSKELTQDSDVLDTWFSSALWPFSTMGWPEDTDLLKKYYPTSVLVTAFDILFFWIARMMMMGIHFMDEVPFHDVYVHALVRDEHGKKMSKSTGNVIDPLKIIDEFGADAFRFTLAAFAAQGRDVKMSEKRIEGYMHFINKLWNAARFVLMNIGEETADSLKSEVINKPSILHRWILSRLRKVMETSADALADYKFNDAASALYQFVWHEFCDWYVEAVKPSLYGKLGEDEKTNAMAVSSLVLRETLVLLHPFIPFVTEEIWHKLPETTGSIMKATHPLDSDIVNVATADDGAETAMELIFGAVSGIRNVRGEMNIAPSLKLTVQVQTDDKQTREILEDNKGIIVNLARLNSIEISTVGERPASAATAIVGEATFYVSLEGIIDFAKEAARLEKEIKKIEGELKGVSKKLNNEDFLAKAPDNVVAKVKDKFETLSEKQQKLVSNLDRIKEFETTAKE